MSKPLHRAPFQLYQTVKSNLEWTSVTGYYEALSQKPMQWFYELFVIDREVSSHTVKANMKCFGIWEFGMNFIKEFNLT